MRDWSYKLAILTVNTSDTVRDPTLGLPRIRMQMETVTRPELITQGCVWYGVGIGKLWTARTRVYRSQILQVNMRLKALDEIDKIYTPLHLGTPI